MRSAVLSAIVIGACLVPAAATHAQAILGSDGPYNPDQRQRQPDEPYTYRLTVTPAAEPPPPLKYTLYPRGYELKPGNSVPMWYRAMWSLDDRRENSISRQLSKNYEKWFTNNLSEIPVDEVRPLLDKLDNRFENARIAAFREEVDWDLRLYDLRGSDTIMFLLSEFQESRTLARILSLQTRLHILDGDFDAALDDMQVAFRLATDVAEPETVINDLLGIAIHAITMENVRHLIDAPGSPNLYWALAQLPQPLFDLRPAVELEMTLLERFFPWLADPLSPPRTSAQWQQLFRDTLRGISFEVNFEPDIDRQTPDATVDPVLLGLILRGYPEARRDLTASGWTENELDAMPVGQVIALHQQRMYQKISQNFAATMLLPYETARTRFDRLEDQLEEDRTFPGRPWQGRETLPMTGSLLAAFDQFYTAATRREVTLKATMAVEAIRMHLAETGRLPESLDEIDVIPVPVSPLNGEAFPYRLDGETAVLDIPFPRFNQRFEIRVER